MEMPEQARCFYASGMADRWQSFRDHQNLYLLRKVIA